MRLGSRFHKLQAVLSLRVGPSAAILPPNVTRIHLDFANSLKAGSMGARKFWHDHLARLKFHNPSIPMIVNRHINTGKSPIMSIYFRKPDASSSPPAERITPASSSKGYSAAPKPDEDERVVTIDMKLKHSNQILEQFLAETKATLVQPAKEDIKELQETEKLKRQSELDRDRVMRVNMEKKREEAMLKRARAAGGLAEEDAEA